MDLEDEEVWQMKRKGGRRINNSPTSPPLTTSTSSLPKFTHEPPVQNNATNTSPVPAQLSPATSIDSLASVDVEELDTTFEKSMRRYRYVTAFFHDNLIKISKPN
ncbi:hypothetical protein Pcinc_012432 [Petrolisthes cinctipes]|uniref:Uncharacterized protein n=1 Tax=Petrolisthes cinctipes TaxID=88211 RepID=A0AAE1G171_PETCI|nr:hypothetical protein Pcinc_012432 [Petrolisthes cinctipes]